ncbi:MAG TPA: isoprenylcysteine carboxylmethyltransferase family protein [Candidatus Sulfotelmatobacter sp.]|nr:isoprenylcysteine carboxylmethyltransferase family protein [Candidatus Sulfotelmatobacter sp.]
MAHYLAALTIVLLLAMVLIRVWLLKGIGIRAIYFGNIDRKDFLIPPFALFYFYMVFASAFHLPNASTQEFFHSEAASDVGVFVCLIGLALFLWSLVSFGRSFRVGIDVTHPNKLVMTGAFAVSRNPIYVAFMLILIGQFLIFSNWILLVYVCAGVWLTRRQILREEVFLKTQYGQEYADYCKRVRRYL